MGVPGSTGPCLNRATNWSSVQTPSGLVRASGVRFGDSKTWLVDAATSIRWPPAKRGPTSAPSSPRSVWHVTHDDTVLARYAPRAVDGAPALVGGGVRAGPTGVIAKPINALPKRVS